MASDSGVGGEGGAGGSSGAFMPNISFKSSGVFAADSNGTGGEAVWGTGVGGATSRAGGTAGGKGAEIESTG